MRREVSDEVIQAYLDRGLVLVRAECPHYDRLIEGGKTSGHLYPTFGPERAKTFDEARDLFSQRPRDQWIAVDVAASGLLAILGGQYECGKDTPRFSQPVSAQLVQAKASRICNYQHEHYELLALVSGQAILHRAWVIGAAQGRLKRLPEGRIVEYPRHPATCILVPLTLDKWVNFDLPFAPLSQERADELEELAVLGFNEKSSEKWSYYQPEEIGIVPPKPRPPIPEEYLGKSFHLLGMDAAKFTDWLSSLLNDPDDLKNPAVKKAIQREAKKVGLGDKEINKILNDFVRDHEQWAADWNHWSLNYGHIERRSP